MEKFCENSQDSLERSFRAAQKNPCNSHSSISLLTHPSGFSEINFLAPPQTWHQSQQQSKHSSDSFNSFIFVSRALSTFCQFIKCEKNKSPP